MPAPEPPAKSSLVGRAPGRGDCGKPKETLLVGPIDWRLLLFPPFPLSGEGEEGGRRLIL